MLVNSSGVASSCSLQCIPLLRRVPLLLRRVPQTLVMLVACVFVPMRSSCEHGGVAAGLLLCVVGNFVVTDHLARSPGQSQVINIVYEHDSLSRYHFEATTYP